MKDRLKAKNRLSKKPLVFFKAGRDHHFKLKHEMKETTDSRGIEVAKHKCSICSKKYQNFKSLQTHIKSHVKTKDTTIVVVVRQASDEKFICYLCLKHFNQKHEFETHIAAHENEFKSDDIIVGEEIQNENVHESAEAKEEYSTNSLILDTCDNEPDESHIIVYDQKELSDNVDYIYEEEVIEEERDLIVKSELKPKNSSKNQEKKSCCDLCGTLFKTKSHLRRHHQRKHQDKTAYKFQCDVCASKFLLRYDLQRHMIKHNSNRESECNSCNKKFKTKASLDIHIKVIHNENRATLEKEFTCQICNRSYFHKRHLDYHMRYFHNLLLN